MPAAESPELARTHDLLVRRATEGLDPSSEQELGRSLQSHPELDPELYERAAAATHLALMPPDGEALPAALRNRIEVALAALAEDGSGGVAEDVQPSTIRRAPDGARPMPVEAPPTLRGQLFLAWTVAAAGLLLACFVWLFGSPFQPSTGSSDGELAHIDVTSLEGTAELPWQSGPSPRSGAVSGRVVWNETRDSGYMIFDSFEGLANNDPSVEQYQLWIFDSERPEETPVDGGVFDLPGGPGERRVEIDPKLPVGQATLFAVTIERPGGVVVSEREHIVAMAQP